VGVDHPGANVDAKGNIDPAPAASDPEPLEATPSPPTPAEERVWKRVRDHQLGVHVRRQHVLLGRFIADFYCTQARLCIEIDGDTHAEAQQEEYDAARTSLLEAAG